MPACPAVAADLDYIINSTGRDLKTFAYTYDSNVTHFRGLTSGTFVASDGINNPGFSFQFRVRVQ